MLFNPRRDAWNEHFDFDAGSFQLLGRTPVGRATIDRLRMNTSYQIEARKYWLEPAYIPKKERTKLTYSPRGSGMRIEHLGVGTKAEQRLGALAVQPALTDSGKHALQSS